MPARLLPYNTSFVDTPSRVARCIPYSFYPFLNRRVPGKGQNGTTTSHLEQLPFRTAPHQSTVPSQAISPVRVEMRAAALTHTKKYCMSN